MTSISRAGRDGARSQGAGIKVGLHVLGIGNGSKPEVLAAVAERADLAGFATLWCGEHVIMVDEPQSRYP
jgi:alkanesulfonate monooxygenase SsuD/methylene tetrahydromethanopterin reductase-like flavin-dependent oxidoreductase (luciferase family)